MGSGGGSSAAREAQQQEDARRRQIAQTQQRIEGIFSSPQREAEIQDFINSNRNILQSDLNRKKGVQDRELKFALARRGLSHGSTDVDQNRELAELYLRGIAEAESRAQNSGANLRADDQASKASLFGQVQGGLDTTTAAQNAAQSMRINAGLNKQNATVGAFDSLFGSFGDIYKSSREFAGEKRASEEFGTLFGPRPKTPVQVAGGVSQGGYA